MAALLFCLLLFMQVLGFFASGLEVKSKICGSDHLAYSNSFGRELFYLNGNLVDKVLFCKVLQLHRANHCLFEGYTGTDYCCLDLSSAVLSMGRRKLLLEPKKKDDEPDHDPKVKRYSNSASTEAGIVVSGIFLTCCVFICPCVYRKKRETVPTVLTRDPKSSDSTSHLDMNVHAPPEKVPPSPSMFSISPNLNRIESVHLNMAQVMKATRNFSPALQIGEGGFGTVYKAQLDSGQVVAIKRAKKEQFENLQKEFSSEVELLAKIDHRNLVKLLGYVDKGNERLIITEYVPNGTLRDHLDGQRGKILDFNQRLEIAIDVAHGLTYLHQYAEKQIIHRDVKRPVEERVTLRWAFRKFNEGHAVDLVDQRMEEVVDSDVLVKMFALAFQCAAPVRNDRPEMKSVGEQLWAIRADYLKSSRRGEASTEV
ncbi:hypothetical protein V6N13_114536 [Hibiscus sabdariffa]